MKIFLFVSKTAKKKIPGSPLPVWSQVHGIDICYFDGSSPDLGKCDGSWTDRPGVAVGARSADCVPILLARNDGNAVAALHSGWRGTFEGIALNWAKITKKRESLSHWRAVLGPSIGPCCFEVSPDLYVKFIEKFGNSISNRFRYLDLRLAIQLDLQRSGVHSVEFYGTCTKCSKTAQGLPVYESYRREGPGKNQLSWIEILQKK